MHNVEHKLEAGTGGQRHEVFHWAEGLSFTELLRGIGGLLIVGDVAQGAGKSNNRIRRRPGRHYSVAEHTSFLEPYSFVSHLACF